jgi:hypothetical protein
MQLGGNNLNTSFNLTPENLENLHTVNTGTPEWEIQVGNRAQNEKIPRSLEWRPVVPKMKLPPFPLIRQRAESETNKHNTQNGGERTPSLRSVFGEMILKKGSILYHTSEDVFSYRADKPMLFCTFHPSEWEGINEYVTRITLKKDVSLLFMVGGFKKTYVHSLLDTLIGAPGGNLAKMYDTNLACYSQHLRKDSFDGWFSSIEGKADVEVALINDSRIFDFSESEELTRNWKNSNNYNNTITLKNWGTRYPISTMTQPAILNLHERFRDQIKAYDDYGKGSKFPLNHVFQVILSNAQVHYHSGPTVFISWRC